ncbi:MAG: dihydrolipoamide acetyltransferase family protein [Lacisediminimonas sp.]|nr:dihydrolipoamide acetyltransferase family protein [Lacisediminimonas sp.]
MFEFKLPSLGADMDEGTLLEWKVKPGEAVHKGQVVAVVDTSKAAIDVEIWQDGTVQALLVEAGSKVPVGAALATLTAPGESAPGEAAPPAAASAAARRQRISPAARQKAQALGLDLSALKGSGADGVVTLADVERAAASAGAEKAVSPPSPAADRQLETRRAIAAAMSRSNREIPHYYLLETIPMGRAQQWLEHENAGRPITERLLMAVLQLKAVALALKKYPEFGGLYQDERFTPAASVHIGVAISLRQGGLIAPALHDVAAKPLALLMQELANLVKRCRAGSLRSSEMTDACVTVTNLGDQGVEAVLGVIYPPQVALVGFGSMARRPWVDTEGTLVVMPTVTASLAADHRVSDGHRGALFLAELRALLQQPEAL